MNLQELIKEHNLKAGDDVVCVDPSVNTHFKKSKVYKISDKRKYLAIVLSDGITHYGDVSPVKFELPKTGKSKKHKHCDLIKAWADGATIENSRDGNQWFEVEHHTDWHVLTKYRIKPDNTEEINQLEIQISDLQSRLENLKE